MQTGLKPSRSTLGQGLAKEDGILDSDSRNPLMLFEGGEDRSFIAELSKNLSLFF